MSILVITHLLSSYISQTSTLVYVYVPCKWQKTSFDPRQIWLQLTESSLYSFQTWFSVPWLHSSCFYAVALELAWNDGKESMWSNSGVKVRNLNTFSGLKFEFLLYLSLVNTVLLLILFLIAMKKYSSFELRKYCSKLFWNQQQKTYSSLRASFYEKRMPNNLILQVKHKLISMLNYSKKFFYYIKWIIHTNHSKIIPMSMRNYKHLHFFISTKQHGRQEGEYFSTDVIITTAQVI